jgi:hypothetical protein
MEPLAPAHYKFQFTGTVELRDKLEELKRLMGLGNDDLAEVIEQAVSEKLSRLKSKRFALTKAPRQPLSPRAARSTRYLAAWLRRAVYTRDGGRCCFTDKQGRRCRERHRLEFHHRHPYGYGGDNHPRNICLMCPTHNRYEAEGDYGRAAPARHLTSPIGTSGGTA